MRKSSSVRSPASGQVKAMAWLRSTHTRALLLPASAVIADKTAVTVCGAGIWQPALLNRPNVTGVFPVNESSLF